MNVGISEASSVIDPDPWALSKPPLFEVVFYDANLKLTAIFRD
jgi:hypothetical protein